MNITIKRYRKKGESIDGHLFIDGSYLCDTAENADSCLPVGSYTVKRYKCKQYARNVPLIVSSVESLESSDVDSLNHSSINHKPLTINQRCARCGKLPTVSSNTTMPTCCPQIKMGNGIHNRKDGSIIVGTYIAPGCLIRPKEPFENICERIRKLDSRGSDIVLTIREDYPPERNALTNFELGQQILKHF